MAVFIVAQRIIRHKGNKVGERSGRLLYFASVPAMIDAAKRRRHVLSYIDSDGNEGTIRSGRRMRSVDAHVRNVTESGLTF